MEGYRTLATDSLLIMGGVQATHPYSTWEFGLRGCEHLACYTAYSIRCQICNIGHSNALGWNRP